MRLISCILAALLLMCCSDNPKEAGRLSMSDNWVFYPCSMGDEMAVIYVNMSAADSIETAPIGLAILCLTFKSPRPNGSPSQEEFEPINAVEDRIIADSKAKGDWYVGCVTVGGDRFFYVYTAREESSWNAFIKELSADSGYEIELTYRDDPEYNGYYEDLYPTEDDWQVIKDLRVIEVLSNQGDDLTQPRKVDHWVYFEDKASSADFVAWAESDRFTEDTKESHATDDGRYCVRLFHQGSMEIDDISSHTIALRQKAAEYGGDYDGWETDVLESGKDE